jgi:hypothetical protein
MCNGSAMAHGEVSSLVIGCLLPAPMGQLIHEWTVGSAAVVVRSTGTWAG